MPSIRSLVKCTSVAMMLLLTACGGCGPDENNDPNNTTANNTSPNNTSPNNTSMACTSDAMCEDGQVCADGVCEVVVSGALVVASEDARSCEVLIEEKSATLSAVVFGEETTGAMRRQAPRVAVAWTRTSDSSFPADAASISVSGEIDGLSIKSARCFDAAGDEIADVEVSLK